MLTQKQKKESKRNLRVSRPIGYRGMNRNDFYGFSWNTCLGCGTVHAGGDHDDYIESCSNCLIMATDINELINLKGILCFGDFTYIRRIKEIGGVL